MILQNLNSKYTWKLIIDLYLHENKDDLIPMPLLEGDEEVKLKPEGTVA